MKKKLLLSMLLALLLLTALAGSACAETPVTLGSFPAGEEMDVSIAWVNRDTKIEVEGLPQGLRIEREDYGPDSLLMLRGKPMYAGDEQFTVWGEEEIVCTLSVMPAVPTVSVPRSVQCGVGDLVDLKAWASTADAGTLSYQWYMAAGSFNETIGGATGNVLRPDTSEAGTVWYCCEVVNDNNGLTSSVMSDYIEVQVRELVVQSVSIESLPLKTEYQVGDEIDTAGLRITVRYDGNYNEIRDDGFTVSPALFDRPGTQSVTVRYGEKSCGFNVTVKNPTETVVGIGVLSLPVKTEYLVGERLDTEGLSIRAHTDDGRYFDVSPDELEFSPTRLDRTGEQTVTVRYAEKTCSFTVRVKEEKIVTGISVLSLPTKRSYTVGDRLDTEGLTVQLNSNKGSEILNEGYSVTPKVLTSPGTQTITVIYGQYQTKFTVTVNAKENTTPTPKPTATPAPTAEPENSPEASGAPDAPDTPETPHPVVTPPMRKNTGVNTAVKIIFGIAVLSLAGLAGYVWYLRRQGCEYEEPGDEDGEEPLDTVSGEPMDDEKKE